MKKLIAAVLTMAMLLTGLPACYAAEDAVTTLTNAIRSFETEVTVKTSDAEATLQEVYAANPELFYYFEGYSATTSKNGKKSTYTFTYHNTEVASDSIFVVDSADTLYYVIGYALAETMESVPIVITDSTINEDSIISAINSWREDNYLAYMGYMGVNATGFTSTVSAFSAWTGYTLSFLYITDTETVQQWRQATEDRISLLCTTLFALDMPDWEKVLLIHDYLVENCSYNEAAAEAESFTVANTAYGCLIEGSAVCEGYAEAAYILFQAAGLNSYYVEGAGESSTHAWNCVEVDGSYYWVDVTWDDPVPADGESENLYHTYFLLTDSELNTDHSWLISKYPSCTNTTWSYTAVKAALEEITDTVGNVTEVYENYSTENVKTLASLISDLQYELGVSATSTSVTVTETTEDAAEETTTEVTTTEKSSSGFSILKLLGRILLVLVLLVVAYVIYNRIMYFRYLKRKRKKAEAKKRAAQKSRSASGQQRTPPTGNGYGSTGYGSSYGNTGYGNSYGSGYGSTGYGNSYGSSYGNTGYSSTGRSSGTSTRRSSGSAQRSTSSRNNRRDNPFR